MPFVQCRFILAVESKDKAIRKVAKLTRGWQAENVKVEPYWKIEGTFDARLVIRLSPKSFAELVLDTITFAASLANRSWSLDNIEADSDDIVFSCMLNAHDKKEPLQWANLELYNKEEHNRN